MRNIEERCLYIYRILYDWVSTREDLWVMCGFPFGVKFCSFGVPFVFAVPSVLFSFVSVFFSLILWVRLSCLLSLVFVLQ